SEFGALIGPLWGGAITDWFGWRTVFWVNLPMAAPVMVAVWRLGGHARHRGRIDWAGAAILGASLAVLTFALVDDPNDPRPVLVTVAMLALAAAGAAAFLLYERRLPEPMVRLDMLASRPIAAANAANLML